jgi:hypothetical protein
MTPKLNYNVSVGRDWWTVRGQVATIEFQSGEGSSLHLLAYLKISAFKSYCFLAKISGAMYNGVPMPVVYLLAIFSDTALLN